MIEALAKKDAMHRAELDAINKITSQYTSLIKTLYDRSGFPQPVFPVSTTTKWIISYYFSYMNISRFVQVA